MKPYIKMLRPIQYSKNAFIFIPAFFGGVFFDLNVLVKLAAIFAAFCCFSSAVYILNDICDLNEDRRHPTKKHRPIASGAVPVKRAAVIGLLLALFGLIIGGLGGGPAALGGLVIYGALNLFYSLYAKHQAIADVVCLALGFVIRVVTGTLGINLGVSPWLVLMVFILSVFLALGKRWHDLSLEEKLDGGTVRKSLGGYSRDFLLVLMTFFATMNTICYMIYSVLARDNPISHGEYFFSTSLWVIIGNMRYLQIIFVHNESYSPTQTLIYDKVMRAVVLLWGLHVGLFLYLK